MNDPAAIPAPPRAAGRDAGSGRPAVPVPVTPARTPPAALPADPLIGVLALQGDFHEHVTMVRAAGARACEVRTAAELAQIDGVILPGGESTTIARLLLAFDLHEPLRQRIAGGMPAWGTCAGAILLANDAPDLDRPPLGVMDISVHRNAFGRQVDSFEQDLAVAGVAGGPVRAVFIRAPVITRAGPAVDVLSRLPDGRIVACREGEMLATAFHPELTGDTRLHRWFVERVAAVTARAADGGGAGAA